MGRRLIIKLHRRLRRQKSKTWCQVYALREIEGGDIYYIGQTRTALAERLRWHYKAVARAQDKPSPVQLWLSGILASGLGPTIDALDANGVWDVSEAVWIDRMRTAGHPLLNIAAVVLSAAELAAGKNAITVARETIARAWQLSEQREIWKD